MDRPRTREPVSLRFRLLFLFLGFTVLVMALLGAGDYIQSVRALEMVVDARAETSAGQAARELERAQVRARSELRTLAEALAREDAGSAERASDVIGRVATAGSPFHRLRLMVDGAEAWSRARAPGPARPCAEAGDTMTLRIAVPGRPGAFLEGLLTPSRFLGDVQDLEERGGSAGHTQVVDVSSGRVLYDSSCESVGFAASPDVAAALVDLRETSGSATRSVRYDRDHEPWHAAVAFVPGLDLGVVVHTGEAAYLAPFRESRLKYLSRSFLVLLVSGLAFLLLARMEFRSLRALTAAAEEIEIGNLRPWLPPPGDDELGRLSLAFRKMADRLAESIRQVELNQKLAAVGELASYLSHEIRNPLSSIRLSLQSLHRDLRGGFIPDDADRVIEIALNEVKRLDGVVRTVLEVGRQEGDIGGRTCPVHDTLRQTLDVIGPKVRAQGVELEFVPRAEHDRVHGDTEALRGVWINLIVNALDALEGTDGGRIRVSTWTGPAAEGELHVRIADNGPGVPPDLVDAIFEPFFTTKRQGNGIGLATAVRTVQPWGGSIAHEPVAAGTGAVFVVRLRLADAEESPDREPPQEQPQTLEPALPGDGAHAA